jgi:hypothetical protein
MPIFHHPTCLAAILLLFAADDFEGEVTVFDLEDPFVA